MFDLGCWLLDDSPPTLQLFAALRVGVPLIPCIPSAYTRGQLYNSFDGNLMWAHNRLVARLRTETAVTVKWIAERLQMGTAGYVNLLLYRRRKAKGK